jgi:hypothetical protein
MEIQNRPYDSAESMNAALLSLYESRLPELNQQIAQCVVKCSWPADKVSKLFFMKVDQKYEKARIKILFVGRETFGWGEYNRLNEANGLMNSYGEVSAYGKHYNSPFWWFREKFSERMGVSKEDFMKGTLWTNLSKIDVNRTTPTGGPLFGDLSQLFVSLLVAEIEIVRPDIVLIMTTSGQYTWHLNYYRWLQNEPFKDFNDKSQLTRKPVLPKKIHQLIAPNRLPEHTYQICHPNALRRRGNYMERADELINTLAVRINQ